MSKICQDAKIVSPLVCNFYFFTAECQINHRYESNNMHKVEVHGAVMYNKWTAKPLEVEAYWIYLFISLFTFLDTC